MVTTPAGVILRIVWLAVSATNLPGATRSSLLLENVRPTNSGEYSVTISNALGVVTSPSAILTVDPAPISPGALDLSFFSSSGANASVRAVDVQPDGNILIGGDFSAYGGTPRNQIARTFPDGRVDQSFDPPVPLPGGDPHSVVSVLAQRDGTVLAAGTRIYVKPYGYYIHSDGYYLVRYTAAGQLDPAFSQMIVTNRTEAAPVIHGVALQENGKIMLCVSQTGVLSFPGASEVVRLLSDGTRDPSFVPPAFGADSGRPAIVGFALQDAGKVILMVGTDLARLNSDGSLETAFRVRLPDIGFQPGTLALQPNGQILVGQSMEGRIVRFNPDGTRDRSFDPQSTLYGKLLVVQKDGKLLIGDSRVQRADYDGVWDPSFVGPQVSGSIFALHPQADGRAMLAGSFEWINGLPRNSLARLWMGPLEPVGVPAIIEQPASQIVSEGERVSFSVQATVAPRGVIRWLFNSAALPAATNAILTLSNVELSAAGSYQVVISNRFGQTRSQIATLTVKPNQSSPSELRVVNPQWQDGQFTVIVPFAAASSRYYLDSKDSLDEPTWTTGSAVQGTNLLQILSDSSGTHTHRFYRVRAE